MPRSTSAPPAWPRSSWRYENVLEGGLTGAGYTLYTMIAVVGISALRVPLAEVVSASFGLVGIWWMLALTAMARAGAMTALWQWGALGEGAGVSR